MKLVEQAFNELFQDRNLEDYTLKIKYTDKFKPYNANVRYTRDSFQFNLSRKWRKISKEIQIGLIQGLMLKVFKDKRKTTNIDLYNSFMKNLHISISKTDSDPVLEQSFDKINEKYFFGLIERPNLSWHNSIRRLGSYEYGTDMISISEVLLQDKELLDYVMYHEMLHKKFKFSSNNGRTHHHTREFKDMEKKFNNSEEMEKKIKSLVRRKSRKRFVLF
jgi:predicted SprT family Zn-dependent metalloprotease